MTGTPPRWNEPQPPSRPEVALAGHLILSQYGRVHRRTGEYEFRETPRFGDRSPAEFEISMQVGQLSPDEIGILVRGLAPPKRIRELERVRWFRVEDLRSAGYVVLRSPGRGVHVSVWGGVAEADRGDLAANKSWWCDSGRAKLDVLAIGIGGDPK